MKANPPGHGNRRSADMRKPTAHEDHKFNSTPTIEPTPTWTAWTTPLPDPAPKRRGAKVDKDIPPKPQPAKESLIGKHRTQRLTDITADERIPQDIRAFLASLQK